jgi:UDP-N-acetylglucosamine--N-acetylmuramyl-(pentapeptide) pyrophosphoryl-undecaprenol N-acetylglucosamine transferase
MKKILVSVCGIGLGHATRSEAVIRELLKKGDADIKVVSYGSGYEYFKENGIDCEEMGGFEYKGAQFTFSVLLNMLDSIRDPTKLRRDYYEFMKIADKFKPDIVLSDTEPNAFFYAYRRSIPNFVLTNLITVLNNFTLIPRKYITRDVLVQQFMVDRLINFIKKRTERFYVPTFEQKLHYMDNVMYTDVIVRKKPSELESEEELRKKLGIERQFYYVSVGGAEIEKYFFNLIEKVLPKFKDKYFVVSSNNMVNKVIERANMKILPFMPNALEWLKISEGIIAPAGHSTISEAICFKKPMLIAPVKNHIEQLVNSRMVIREGFGDACYFERDTATEDLFKSIEKFFTEEKAFKLKLDNSKVNGSGAGQIAENLLNY